MATSTRQRGLKTDAYNGPLILTHHAITTTMIPEDTIPCKNTTNSRQLRVLFYQPYISLNALLAHKNQYAN